MSKSKWNPWAVVFGCITMIIVDQVLMLLGAIMIGYGVLAYDAAAVWSILSVLFSSLAATVVCTAKFSLWLYAYLSGGLFLAAIFISSLLTRGAVIELSNGTKMILAVIAGAFLGNFAGDAIRAAKKGRRKRINNAKKYVI